MIDIYEVMLARSSHGKNIDFSAYATSLLLEIDSSTYVVTATLKNKNGDTLGTPQTIDLPLETVVVGGSYDDSTKKVILTLKNGNTVEFSVADLVDGLQPEITANNKLSSDLVDDTNHTNKFVTSSEKSTWNGKQDALTFDNSPTANSNNPVKSGGIYTALSGKQNTINSSNKLSSDLVDDTNHTNKFVTSSEKSTWNGKQDALTFDNSPTANSNNPVKSGGIYTALSGKQNTINSSNKLSSDLVDDTNHTNKFVTSSEKSAWNGKQDALTFDSSPTANSNNPVKSGGIYTALSGKQNTINSSNRLSSDLVDDTNHTNKFVTAAEKTKIQNAITSEEYNAGKTVPSGTEYIIDNVTYTVGDNAEKFNNYSLNKAVGDYSHAEGCGTAAIGSESHAEGYHTTAKGGNSHSEGYSTKATGGSSHAEGYMSTSSGNFSHAEGHNSTSSGIEAHAEGNSTVASGNRSHAEGLYTTAASELQHVQGKYNVVDSNGKYAHIIGNGTGDNNRSNAFAVDWDGKIYVNNSQTGVDVSTLASDISGLGNAAYKSYTTSVTSGSSSLVTSGGVYTALQGNSFTITKTATDCNLSYTANKLGNIVVINLKITTTSAWTTNTAKVIASVPSSVAPTSFQSVGFVTVGSLPSKHGAWLNTDYKIRMNVQEAIDSGKSIYITFFYAL